MLYRMLNLVLMLDEGDCIKATQMSGKKRWTEIRDILSSGV